MCSSKRSPSILICACLLATSASLVLARPYSASSSSSSGPSSTNTHLLNGLRSTQPQRMKRTLTEVVGLSKICSNNTPCGWEVYIPFSRRFDYFMDNTCKCPASTACVLTDDDLSVSAYVYRCRPLGSSAGMETFTSGVNEDETSK